MPVESARADLFLGVLFIIVYVVFLVLIFGVATLPFLMGG